MRSVALQLMAAGPANATAGGSNASAAALAAGQGGNGEAAYSSVPLWWAVTTALPLTASDEATGSQAALGGSGQPVGLYFDTVSDNVAPPLLVSALGSSYSVLAIYVTVVLAGALNDARGG